MPFQCNSPENMRNPGVKFGLYLATLALLLLSALTTLQAQAASQASVHSQINTAAPTNPLLNKTILYAGTFSQCGNACTHGALYALNAGKGSALWTYHTPVGINSIPTVVNKVVYFSDGEGKIYALHASSGKVVWKKKIGLGFPSSPVIDNGVLYVGGDNPSALFALDASNGNTLWSYTVGTLLYTPAVANGIVYFTDDSENLYAVNVNSHKLIWEQSIGSGYGGAIPVVNNGMVYLASGSSNTFYAFDATSGSMLWSYQTGGASTLAATVSNGVVYVGSYDNNLYALQASNGQLLWKYQAASSPQSIPSVANGTVYFGTYGSQPAFYALNATKGTLVWTHNTGDGGNVFGNSPVVGKTVMFGTDYSIYSLHSSDGSVKWQQRVNTVTGIAIWTPGK